MKSTDFKHFDPPFDHHEDLAQHLVSGYKLSSTIIVSDPLDSVYTRNPEFAKIENHFAKSKKKNSLIEISFCFIIIATSNKVLQVKKRIYHFWF